MIRSIRYNGIEKRRYLRLDEDSSFVFYSLHKRISQEIKESTINNISVNGLCFDILEPINRGINLECEIYQPLYCRKDIIVPISILVKVVWIKRIEKEDFLKGGNNYRVGVEFSEIKEKDREKIVEYVEENNSGQILEKGGM